MSLSTIALVIYFAFLSLALLGVLALPNLIMGIIAAFVAIALLVGVYPIRRG